MLRERFAALLDPGRVIDHPLERRLYARDGSIAQGDCGLVVLPETTAEVVACVRLAHELGLPVVPRGSGTGLCGGAVPLDGRHRALGRADDAHPRGRPDRALRPGGAGRAEPRPVGRRAPPRPALRARPLAASRRAPSAATSPPTPAGPHCLASGVTAQHVLGMEIVLADGEVLRLGGTAPDPPGYDLRGFVVGGEGTLGVVTEVTVRLMRNPPRRAARCCSTSPPCAAAGEAVGGIIAAGVIPAAMEMMDQQMTVAVEAFVHADLPVDAAAMLLVEVDGTAAEVASHTAVVERVGAEHRRRPRAGGARRGRAGALLEGAQERLRRRRPHRAQLLPARLRGAAHAAGRGAGAHRRDRRRARPGDHERLPRRRRQPAPADRVRPARRRSRWSACTRRATEIIEACVAVGGVLSGEHGIGLEKRDFMPLTFTAVDLDAQACAREAFDPEGRMNPAKVLPLGSRCGELVLDAGSLPRGHLAVTPRSRPLAGRGRGGAGAGDRGRRRA